MCADSKLSPGAKYALFSVYRLASNHHPRTSNHAIRWKRWIWFVGCAVWVVDASVSIRLHDGPHAKLAMAVAAVFLVAGLFYQAQKR
jgi:hypothetical protein